MQTNAPASSEWVDQYNRAFQYGQVTIDQSASLPAHASTHASGGSDPVTPVSIGAMPLVSNNNAIAPARIVLRVDNVDLLAANGTRTSIYTVPAGSKFLVSSLKIVLTSTNQSVQFTTAPSFCVTNTATAKGLNDLALRNNGTLAAGDLFTSGGDFGSGNSRRVSIADTVGFQVTAALSGGTQSIMLATVIITGELYS
jgi:hypothetical protein